MNKEKGVSLIELVLVLTVVIGLAIILSTIPSSINQINFSHHSSVAKDVANMEMDNLRKSGYSSLTNGTTNFSDSQLSALPNARSYYQVSDCPAGICKDNESLKEVKINVSWTEGKNDSQVELDTLIGQGGLGQ